MGYHSIKYLTPLAPVFNTGHMKRNITKGMVLFLVSGCLIFLSSCVTSDFIEALDYLLSSADVAGTYSTDYGDMVLMQNGDYVWGEYQHDGGTLEGTISGNVLTGTWKQASSSGQLQFMFDDAGFTGKWSYGNDTPTASWNGTKIEKQQVVQQPVAKPMAVNLGYLQIAGTYDTGFGKMILRQNGSVVSGEYEHNGGILQGTISGNILSGTWTETSSTGMVRFEFSSDGSGFTGLWSYGNAEPVSAWDGVRTSLLAAVAPKLNQKPMQPAPPPVAAPSSSGYLQVAGSYDSAYGKMLLRQNGSVVSGEYEYNGGLIEGTIEGNVLSGTWKESSSNGKIRFVFNVDGSAFTGFWGNGNEEPTSPWDGVRTGVHPVVPDLVQQPLAQPVEHTAPVQSGYLQVSGTYDTGFGKMVLRQSGSLVSGEYDHNGGVIEGTITGNVLSGTWTETSSKGRLKFVFKTDGSTFAGLWSYGDAELVSQWDGVRTSAQSTPTQQSYLQIAGKYSTGFGDMVLRQNGASVSGEYTYNDGLIEGTLSGNILTGTWKETSSSGTIRFVFKSDGSGFTGKWAPGDNEPSSGWDGQRI